MGSEYRAYLAAQILNEDRIVTYRLLSRALKVHVNTAKEMLFEFHRQQNVKKPGSVHATYLLAGIRHKDESYEMNGGSMKGVEDDQMQSSPFQSSPMPHPPAFIHSSPVLSICLVREEDLLEIRSHYKIIKSIHVYSLEPTPFKDLQTLSDVTRELKGKYANQDPLDVANTYGTIVNKGVRRRTGRRPPPQPPSTQAVPPAIAKSKPTPVADKKESSVTPSSTQSSASKDIFGKSTSKKEKPANLPALKRDSSNIFKSFAKMKPKVQRETADSSAAGSSVESGATSDAEDESMKGVSEDEEENYVPPVQPSTSGDADRKSRKQREEELRKMMEDDDNDDNDLSAPATEPAEQEVPMSAELPQSEGTEKAIETTGGRRRGKRKVVKKKTVKDEEGYLVTREEAVWESFSEDEPVTKSKAQIPGSSTSNKPKKVTAKGQGSIMSFFGKPK